MPERHEKPLHSVACSDYQDIRNLTVDLVSSLSDADATLQSMEDASPAKWHLAHTAWFFETFVLVPNDPTYRVFDERFGYLFNSYYDSVGDRHARPQRGMLSRPTLDRVLSYRESVDQAIARLVDAGRAPEELILLGLNHEQQHQELLLTDILHAFAQNPLCPAFRRPELLMVDGGDLAKGWTSFDGGKKRIGAEPNAFHYDCEGPAHEALVTPFALKNRAVTVKEWKAFIADGGYENSHLWLSDGWAVRQREEWCAPHYWRTDEDQWQIMTLRGLQDTDDDAPVSHISFYEADAFATWAGARLPTEQEWEIAAQTVTPDPQRMLSKRLRPAPQVGTGLTGMFGDVWEWTRSAFLPYPGFKPAEGAVGEYNGKFMSGQMVLRGGSCVTPPGHIRPTYRNFFHPDKRWQFSGLRLARDE